MSSTISIDVDIEEFSDDAILEAVKDRCLSTDGVMSEDEFILRARQLIRQNDRDGLFAHVSDYVRDQLGLAIV